MKQKISARSGYADWEGPGVLPYIDLELWRLIALRDTILRHVIPRIIYSDRLVYTAKNVRETTLPLVDKRPLLVGSKGVGLTPTWVQTPAS